MDARDATMNKIFFLQKLEVGKFRFWESPSKDKPIMFCGKFWAEDRLSSFVEESQKHFEKAEFLKRNVSEKYRAVLTAQVLLVH